MLVGNGEGQHRPFMRDLKLYFVSLIRAHKRENQWTTHRNINQVVGLLSGMVWSGWRDIAVIADWEGKRCLLMHDVKYYLRPTIRSHEFENGWMTHRHINYRCCILAALPVKDGE